MRKKEREKEGERLTTTQVQLLKAELATECEAGLEVGAHCGREK